MRKSGFTLLEVLVVLIFLSVIIGMLYSFFDFERWRVDQIKLKLLSDFARIEMAVQKYKMEKGYFPESNDGFSNRNLLNSTYSDLVPNYIYPVPVPDPVLFSTWSYDNLGYNLSYFYDSATGRRWIYICVITRASDPSPKWNIVQKAYSELRNAYWPKIFIVNVCGDGLAFEKPSGGVLTYTIYKNY